jgi:hypothetical protein
MASGCDEMVMIQICDREGFQTLLARLQSHEDFTCTVQPVDKDVYAFASSITRRAVASEQIAWEQDVKVEYEYAFPSSFGQVNVDNDNLLERAAPIDGAKRVAPTDGAERLVHTDRECFAIVKISRTPA